MRRATLRTTHDDAATAERIAAALAPDDTDEIETRSEGATLATTVERPTTGGLHATLDDYVVNVDVAAQLANRE